MKDFLHYQDVLRYCNTSEQIVLPTVVMLAANPSTSVSEHLVASGRRGFMKVIRGALIGGAFLLATASSGFAQDITSGIPFGVYVRCDVGGSFGTNTTFKDTSPNASNSLLHSTTQ